MSEGTLRPVATLALVLLALPLVLTSCSSASKVQKTSTVAYRLGLPGATLIETYTMPVTVAELDSASRKVTFVAPDGSRNTFISAPGNARFDQLRVGSRVQAAVTRELLVFPAEDRAALERDPITPALLTPADAQAGVLKSDTIQRTATIAAVDAKRRQTSLVFPDGTFRTFPVREDVDLRHLKPGAEVVIRTSSRVVLTQ